jgi:hypothetical protein
MSETVRTFVMEGGVWVAKRVPKGHRKPEWNNENEKMARKIRSRQRDYEQLIQRVKGSAAGFRKPGSAS